MIYQATHVKYKPIIKHTGWKPYSASFISHIIKNDLFQIMINTMAVS